MSLEGLNVFLTSFTARIVFLTISYPTDGEKVSEEENSGDEEDFNPEDDGETNSGKRKQKQAKEAKSR